VARIGFTPVVPLEFANAPVSFVRKSPHRGAVPLPSVALSPQPSAAQDTIAATQRRPAAQQRADKQTVKPKSAAEPKSGDVMVVEDTEEEEEEGEQQQEEQQEEEQQKRQQQQQQEGQQQQEEEEEGEEEKRVAKKRKVSGFFPSECVDSGDSSTHTVNCIRLPHRGYTRRNLNT